MTKHDAYVRRASPCGRRRWWLKGPWARQNILEAAKKAAEQLQEQLTQAEEAREVARAAVTAADAEVNALHKRALAELNGAIPAAAAECKEAYDRAIGSIPEHVVQAPENKHMLEQLEAALAAVLKAAKGPSSSGSDPDGRRGSSGAQFYL